MIQPMTAPGWRLDEKAVHPRGPNWSTGIAVKLHGCRAVASSPMFRRNPPKHTLLRQGFGPSPEGFGPQGGGYPLLAFIHGLTPVAFCVGG
jgi:hypothetical protein